MAIALIIRTKNEENSIGRVLANIFSQKHADPIQIIIVDSGSSDRTLEIVSRYQVTTLHIPAEQFTYGYSLNYGIQHAQGDIVVCLSAHCIPCDDLWLSNLTAPIQQGKTHATFGRQVAVKGMNPFEEVSLSKHFPAQARKGARVPFSNANCAFLKTMWEEVHFDELIPGWEDYLWYLSSKDKYLFRYVPDACVIHSHPFSLTRIGRIACQDGSAFRRMQEQYGFNILERTSSLKSKADYVMKDLSSHTVFFLKQGYLRHLAILPFVKGYAYLNYWRGYHTYDPQQNQTIRTQQDMSKRDVSGKAAPKVSFIIPHWNQRTLLEECIVSILNTGRTIPYEIIVIDNASQDDSAAYIQRTFPDIRLIRNVMNLGYAKAINQGADRATGDFLFFLNNDIQFLENTTEQLISFLAKHPDAGAVAPILMYPDGRIQISCRRFPTPSALFLQLCGIKSMGAFRAWKLDIEEQGRGGIIQQPMASALLVRRACWNAVGPMDERFFLYFNDVDWCYRLSIITSYKIYLCPEARVIHHGGASTKRLGRKRTYEFYRGLFRFYRKYYLRT